MGKTINIDLFKENPQLFFSQLPKNAKKEYMNMLEYILYKYDVNYINYEKKNSILNDFAELRTGLPKNYKFNRDEANERWKYIYRYKYFNISCKR